MVLTSTIEKNESWKFRETKDGQELVRVFYALWDDVFSPSGASPVLPEIGDPLPESTWSNRPDMKVISIDADPSQQDVDGCNVRIVYSNVTKDTFPKNRPDDRLSWEERFYTITEVIETDRYYSELDPTLPMKHRFTSGKLNKDHFKDKDGNVIPQPINISNFIYEITYRSKAPNVDFLVSKLQHCNNDAFIGTRYQSTSNNKYLDKIGLLNMGGNDINSWLYNNLIIVREAVDSWAITMEFQFRQEKWRDFSRDGGHLIPEVELAPLLLVATGEAGTLRPSGSH